MIGFAFDFTSVGSLLAYRPTCALADELRVDVDWLPFSSPPRPAPPRSDDESVGERHARVRAEYQAAETARYAEAAGIEIRRDPAGTDSTLACAGCLGAAAAGQARAYLDRVLFAFWADQLDIEDPDAIGAVLRELGVADFDSETATGQLAALREDLAGRGVFAVPTYLVEDELFIGRAHLPMIRWLLTGRQGPGPL